MLLAEKSEPAVCGPDDHSSNPANNPESGELWGDERTIHADVIGWLCRNAEAFGRTASNGINVYGAKIVDDLGLSYEDVSLPLVFMHCYFRDEIWLKNAKILSLNLTGCRTHRILADGLQTANHIFFCDGFHAKGEVLFRDATIGGSFNAVGATFEYEPSEMSRSNSTNSLGCDRIKVNGSMLLRSSSFKGEVGLAGAFIGSNLECDSSTFENPFNAQDGNRFAIRADRITVSGSVFLRQRFASKGAVWLMNASMSVLDCSGSTFEGDNVNALRAECASISGYAVFDNSVFQNGRLALRAITAGDMTLHGAEVAAVDLRFASIRRNLRFKKVKYTSPAVLDLRNAATFELDDEKGSWPESGALFLDGFKYERFGSANSNYQDDPSAPTDWKSRKRWIDLDTSHPPHALRQLAHVYAVIGETQKSRKVLFSLEELLHLKMIQESNSPFRRAILRIWRQVLKWTIGYGYKLWLSGLWLVLLLALGSIFSYWGYYAHIVVPTDKSASIFFARHWYAPNDYPPFSVTMFTIENSLPAINFAMSDHWAVDGCVRYWFMWQKILGWLLSILFVAGITGLAKSDK